MSSIERAVKIVAMSGALLTREAKDRLITGIAREIDEAIEVEQTKRREAEKKLADATRDWPGVK